MMACPSCGFDNQYGVALCQGCGRRLDGPPATLSAGSRIAGRYEILTPLGRGGMGTVFKAHDLERDEVVAVKILSADLTADRESERRLAASIALARKVSHPNVCRIYDSGEYDGQRFIAMELVEGHDLHRALELHGPPPPEEALAIAIQTAVGLGAIHEAGLVHRDIKASNLMRDPRGVVKILDLGLAHLPEALETPTASERRIFGTPDYMSPEQIRGERVDGRADIYSLGIVMFEQFTGAVPFRGATPLATLYAHLHEQPPLERLPDAVRAIVGKALAKAREDRYATARELADALRQVRTSMAGEQAALDLGSTAVGAEELVVGEGIDLGSEGGELFGAQSAEEEISLGAEEPGPAAEPAAPVEASLDPHHPGVLPSPSVAAAHEPPLAVYENAQFTVYRPRAVEPMRWYPLLVFAHLEELPPGSTDDERKPTERVRQDAERILGDLAGAYSEARQDSSMGVPHEAEITFVPEIPGFEVNPPRATFLWLEPVHRQDFRLRARTAAEGQVVRGRVSVFWGRIVLADVAVSIRVGSATTATAAGTSTERSAARPFRKIFASYSHKDVGVVEELARYGRTLGDVYLRDVTHLRSGEQWDQRLLGLISEADVFQLFWSWNALQSSFVEKEWRYALSLERPHFIRPTYWQEPLPALPDRDLPPDALRRLHFQLLPAGPGRVATHPPGPEAAARATATIQRPAHGDDTGTMLGVPAPAREHTGAMPAVSRPAPAYTARPGLPAARSPRPAAQAPAAPPPPSAGPAPAAPYASRVPRGLLAGVVALLGVGILGATSLVTFMVMRAPAPRPPATPPPNVYATAFPVPPRTGRVEVRITPGTEVAVDGKVVGRTPLEALVLEAGEHTLVLSHPRYGRTQRRIKVTPGETTTVEVDLRLENIRRHRNTE